MGLTMNTKDEFAKAAMTVLLTQQPHLELGEIADKAYRMAREMMSAREHSESDDMMLGVVI